MKRVGAIQKHSTFFYNIFLPVSIIRSVLIIAFGSFIYPRTYKDIQKTLVQNQQNFVQQVKGNLDQKIQIALKDLHSCANQPFNRTFKEGRGKEWKLVLTSTII